jgi:hypothetical protein
MIAGILSIILAILLTPAGGFETRPIGDVQTAGFATLALFFAGIILNLVSVILIFSRPRRASEIAIIGSILFFPVILVDQAGLFSSLTPPTSISYLEFLLAIELVVIIFFASKVHSETMVVKPVPT